MAKQDLSSGSINLPGFEDLGIDYGDSYSPTRGTGQQDYFTNIEPMGGVGENLMDDAAADMIKKTVVQSLTNPAIGYMRPEDYYPDINRSINVGTFSGPLGSVPLFAAGGGYEPLGVLDAKNAARQQQMDEYQKQMLEGIAIDYKNIKDKIRNEGWLEKQDQLWSNYYDTKLKAAGGNKLIMGIMAKDDPERKLLQAKIDNATNAFDRYFDEATSIVLQYQGAGKKDESQYVSPYMAQKAQDFLNFYTKKDLTLENIKDFNPNEFAKALAIEKAAAETMKLRGTQIGQNVSSYIYNALNAKKMGLGDLQNTDKNQVYAIMEKTGLDKAAVDALANADYEVAYGRAKEVYGKDADNIIPSYNEFRNYYEKLVHEQVKLTMQEVAQSGVEERARAAKINQETFQPIVRQEQNSLFRKNADGTPQKEGVYKIPYAAQKDNPLVFTASTPSTKFDYATQKSVVEAIPKGSRAVVGEIAHTEDGTLWATVYTEKMLPQTYQDGSPILDAQGNQVYEKDFDYSNPYRVPYNTVKSNVESNAKIPGFILNGETVKSFGEKPYTQSGGTGKTYKGLDANGNPIFE